MLIFVSGIFRLSAIKVVDVIIHLKVKHFLQSHIKVLNFGFCRSWGENIIGRSTTLWFNQSLSMDKGSIWHILYYKVLLLCHSFKLFCGYKMHFWSVYKDIAINECCCLKHYCGPYDVSKEKVVIIGCEQNLKDWYKSV